MKLTLIISLILAISLTSVLTADVKIKPLNQEHNTVVTVSPKCEDVKIVKWDKPDYPKEEKTIKEEDLFSENANYISFKYFKLTTLQAEVPKLDGEGKAAMQSQIDNAINVSGCKAGKRFNKLVKKEKKANQQTKEGRYSYFSTFDATSISASQKSSGYPLSKKQYFDDATQKREYYEDNQSKNKWNVEPTIETVLADFKLVSDKDFVIQYAKLYYREGGVLPTDKVKVEMQKGRANPTTHIPSTGDAFLHFVMEVHIDANNRSPVRHEFIELCAQSVGNGNFHRFVVDRGSRETALSDTFATRIRLIYLGVTNNCHPDSETWLSQEVSKINGEPSITTFAHGPVFYQHMSSLIKLNNEYVDKFPVYNTLVNCQHYATNVFNQLTNQMVDYESHALMDDHSDASQKQTSKSIKFGLTLAKKARLHRRFRMSRK